MRRPHPTWGRGTPPGLAALFGMATHSGPSAFAIVQRARISYIDTFGVTRVARP